MAEPTVPVPVSLDTEALRRVARNEGLWEPEAALVQAAADEIDRLRALLSQPTPTAEHECTGPHADGRPESCVCAAGHDHAHDEQAAESPRIEDMAPGTTFTYPTRWEVSGRGGMTGRVIAEMVEENMTRYLDDLDPSTIRDVTPPSAEGGA